MKAIIREEKIVIPTYKAAKPETAPLFIEKRVYQGSAGKVYPFPVTEKIYDEKEDREYTALILENDYIYVMILPELGGRIQRAYDKTNGYDFVYYNRVIKPALVGLAGPWISGGIEFNWPQHHRPSTFLPVDYSIEEREDGSVTAFLSEIDSMYGTKGMAAVTIYPDKAYIEIKGQLFNPTDFPQTFLWWANPAVSVNADTYSVFPPDVHAVYDHGKRDVSTFPIATGIYYKADYSAGVDISRYKNIKVPTSYMAASSDFDFIGNFDEGKDAGLLHIADHHIAPGKKQWTWGCGEFGKMWDKNLTDEDGPYIELMTGVFTDNQPDFTWLKPQEEKIFTQYFMPYKTVGRVQNATKDIVIGYDDNLIKIYATGKFDDAVIQVMSNGIEVYSKKVNLSPDKCFVDTVEGLENYSILVFCAGRLLCKCDQYISKNEKMPVPAEALKAPEELDSLEELYLAGQHLEQYRHATYNPADYYLEGLKRDQTDIRLNNAYGLLLLRQGLIKESIPYFERAIAKQTWRNPNPYYGEVYFNLGLAYELLGEYDKAYDSFYKSTWSAETQSGGFYHLACLATRNGNYHQALEHIETSLLRNGHNMKARVLKAELLSLCNLDNAEFLDECYAIDRLSMGILFQKGKSLGRTINYLKLACDYMQYGLYLKAVEILNSCKDVNPMLEYCKGYAYAQINETDKAKRCYNRAESLPSDYIFPNTIEEMLILEHVTKLIPDAPMAYYYLGNLLYDKKQYGRAITCWETATIQKPVFAMPYRNLSIAYYNKQRDIDKAIKLINTACELEPDNSRFLLEQDQLFAKADMPKDKRLEKLAAHKELLEDRDMLMLAYISLLNDTRQYEKALSLLSAHTFHVWEGGEGKVAEQYKTSLFALAEIEYNKGNYKAAVNLAQKTLHYPDNLGEGKLENVPDNQAYYVMGKCYKKMYDQEKAHYYFELAALGNSTPQAVRYYNDQPSDYIYYQALAHNQLGHKEKATELFRTLLDFAEEHIGDEIAYDFFAVSLPELEVYQEDRNKRNKDYCIRLIALGKKGLKEIQNETDD